MKAAGREPPVNQPKETKCKARTTTAAVQCRASSGEPQRRRQRWSIRGLAAVFYRAAIRVPSTGCGMTWLSGSNGTFDRAIKEAHDARGLFNHDGNMLLARVSSGTLRLSVNSEGLAYEIDVDAVDPTRSESPPRSIEAT